MKVASVDIENGLGPKGLSSINARRLKKKYIECIDFASAVHAFSLFSRATKHTYGAL